MNAMYGSSLVQPRNVDCFCSFLARHSLGADINGKKSGILDAEQDLAELEHTKPDSNPPLQSIHTPCYPRRVSNSLI